MFDMKGKMERLSRWMRQIMTNIKGQALVERRRLMTLIMAERMASQRVWWMPRNEIKIREQEACLEWGGIWGDDKPKNVTMGERSRPSS